MQNKIDYLAIERKTQTEGSYNAAVKELVVALRELMNLPSSEIDGQMPHIRNLEKKIHKFDDMFGEPQREYIKQIWDVLENEPEPDESKSFLVCKLEIKSNNQINLLATGESFTQHVLAKEWVKEEADRTYKYVILEVIEPAYLP